MFKFFKHFFHFLITLPYKKSMLLFNNKGKKKTIILECVAGTTAHSSML